MCQGCSLAPKVTPQGTNLTGPHYLSFRLPLTWWGMLGAGCNDHDFSSTEKFTWWFLLHSKELNCLWQDPVRSQTPMRATRYLAFRGWMGSFEYVTWIVEPSLFSPPPSEVQMGKMPNPDDLKKNLNLPVIRAWVSFIIPSIYRRTTNAICASKPMSCLSDMSYMHILRGLWAVNDGLWAIWGDEWMWIVVFLNV